MSMIALTILGQITILVIAFLAGTTYTDSTREQENRRQAKEWRRINAARARLQHRTPEPIHATMVFTAPDPYKDDD